MKKSIMISFLILFVGCDFSNTKFVIINNTDSTVYYWLKLDTNLNNLEYYIYKLESFKVGTPSYSRSKSKNVWEYKINNYSIDSMLHVYILYEKEISQKIIDNREFKHYKFSVKDLDSMNWVFVYNGE